MRQEPQSIRKLSTLYTVVIGLACAVALAAPPATAAEMKVTLLGTGTPSPRVDRFSQSTLVEAGQEKLLFDFGRGVTIRLAQRKIPFGTLTAHFITHMHSDHVVGLPDLWLTGRLPAPYALRKTPMVIYGPKGTVAMTQHLTQAFAEDIRIRAADEAPEGNGIDFAATDIEPGLVYDKNGVKVTAYEVNHGEAIRPAYGYIVEYDGKKVVFSGDTKYDERVAKAAKGADLLIHEVADIPPEMIKAYPKYRKIADHHATPEEAGRIFAMAKPKLVVYSHIVVAKPKGPPTIVPEEILQRTRSTYDGKVVVGEDLMSFVIDGDVKIVPPPKGKPAAKAAK